MTLSRFLDRITLSLPSATTTQYVGRSWPGWLSKRSVIYWIQFTHYNKAVRPLIRAASKLPLFMLRGKWCADCLMIDGLVGHCGEHLTNLWKRDEGGTGQYPPPTLHVSSDLYIIFQLNLFSFSFCKSQFFNLWFCRHCWTFISWTILTKLPNMPLYP